MILKFRESTISRLERLRKREKEGADNQEDVKEREIVSRKVDFAIKWAYPPVQLNKWHYWKILPLKRGSVGERLERWICNSEASILSWPLAGFVHGSPEFKSSIALVNSQLVCFRPFEILNPVKFYLIYLFQSFVRPL